MLLVLTNSKDATADYLCAFLAEEGIEHQRLDTDSLLQRVHFRYEIGCPLLSIDDTWYTPNSFHCVWYRRPERLKHPEIADSPEGKFVLEEWSESLECFLAHINAEHWVNHPANNVRASHKLEQLSRAKEIGLSVPDTLVSHEPSSVRAFHGQHRGNVIVKPMASGYVERPEPQPDSLIYTNVVSAEDLTNLDDLSGCPTFFQRAIDKRSDVRITLLDEHVHAVELIATEGGRQRCDIRRNNMEDVIYQTIDVPHEVLSRLRTMVNSYQLRFAAIDMAVEQSGNWVFFEINPNGQWAWLDLAGATRIADSFADVFSRG